MNDQQALSIFAADPEAGLVDGGKYQNSCGFLAKLSSAGNLAFKTMKCVVNPDIGPEVASPVEGISPRTRIATQSNAVLPLRNISSLVGIADKGKGRRERSLQLQQNLGFRAVDLMAVLSPGAICTFPFLCRSARLWHSMGSVRRTLLISIAKPRPPTSGVFHWPASAKRGIPPAHLRAKNSSTAAS
jgi:hypothetical protein